MGQSAVTDAVCSTAAMEKSESFYRLTPASVLEAVESAGMTPTGHCTALNALENRVFDVRVESDGDRPFRHLVAKFYRPGRWSPEAIGDEHRLLFALREAEIPVCAPIRFDDGDSLRTIHDIHYALWPRTGGRSPDELSDAQVEVLGRLLARIHAVAASVEAPHRPRFDSKEVPLYALDALEAGNFIPPSCSARYRAAVEQVVEIYDRLAKDTALQPIHGDCHLGNLLYGDAGWFFLDFDDMRLGPAVQDVWMLLPGRDAYAERQRRLLVEAYRTFRPFDERSLALVEPLRAFRFVFYAGWIARRWDDPSFPDAFPHFGSEDYWESETRDLEEQLERIRLDSAADPRDMPTGKVEEAEATLTNKDFFWDL
jgi:Ser/Thr protein kinase RdoA (MazF antagonist)